MISKQIIGLRIEDLEINPDKTILRVVTNSGHFDLVAIGDCCSKSWFEHISGVKNVIGGTIMESIDNIPDESSVVENDDFNVDKFYSTIVKTNKGTLELEYRNNSNGYYGGWLQIDGDQYGDPVDPSEFLSNFNSLTEDF